MSAGVPDATGAFQEADDVCALPLVRRLSATLDIDPSRWHEGDALPRGWHLAFFTVDTPHSKVRADGHLQGTFRDVGGDNSVFTWDLAPISEP